MRRGSLAPRVRLLPTRLRVEWLEARQLLSTFTVTDTSDDVNDAGSLRHAITQSNLTGPGPNTIDFNIPGTGPFTIAPATVLPRITVPVKIDGYSQPGASPNTLANGDNAVLQIDLDGSNLPFGEQGLAITAGNSSVRGLVISGFRAVGASASAAIALQNSGGDVIAGNFLGTNVAGTAATAAVNALGLLTTGSPNDTIGGTSPADRNIIAGNADAGIDIEATSTGTLVEGNFIGTDVTGTKALANGGAAIFTSASNTTVGGTASGAGNLIAGNGFGINDEGLSTSGLLVQGNLIGTDITGTKALRNSGDGVVIQGSNSTIGGTAPGARNVIAGNNVGAGIRINGKNNVVQGNFIGTDITGTKALGNADGVICSASGNTIGGAAAGAGNVIADNGGPAVGNFGGVPLSGLLVQGNLIGVGADGTTPLGNVGDSVSLSNVSSSTIQGNTIAFNSGNGVSLFGGTMDLISRNAIFSNSNASQGILLANNANNAQPAPVLTFTPNSGGNGGTLSGTLTAAPNTTFTVELFTNATLPPPGHEEGQTFLTSTPVNTNASGVGSFSLPEATAIYTATATDPNNNTSEFSNAAGTTALQATTTQLASSANPSTVGQSVTFTAIVAPASGTGTPTGTVTFSVDGQAQTPSTLSVVNGVDQATFSSSTLTAGPHTIAAAYSGDTTFASSTAAPLTQTVNALSLQATATTLSSSANPSTVGQAVTFEAVVATQSGTATPTGTVTFSVDGQAQTPSTLSVVNGVDQATFSSSTLAAGPHTIAAAYSGDTTFATSTATPLTQTVNPASLLATTTQLASSALPSTVGQTVTFTATVSGINGGTPTGTVTFEDGTTPLGTIALNPGGQAVFAVASLAQGAHAITAIYSGDSRFALSTANAVNQVVNQVILPTVPPPPPPTVLALRRFGFHAQPTTLVLSFSTALDPARAQDLGNYQLALLGHGGRPVRTIGVASAVYDPSSDAVTLTPNQRLCLQDHFQLTVIGTAPNGVRGATGLLLDGNGNGNQLPGSNFVREFGSNALAGSSNHAFNKLRFQSAGRGPFGGLQFTAVDALAASGELTAGTVKARFHHR